jgi:predicted ArsR family transcriptional regulator
LTNQPVKAIIKKNIFYLIIMSTPNQIIDYLKQGTPRTVSEIAQALDLTKADIRYHLTQLLQSNAITVAESTQHQRGRPASRYLACQHPTPARLEFLLNALTTFATESFSSEQLASKLWQQQLANIPSETSPRGRIKYAIEYLMSLGITANWSAGKQGPQISIASNPYKNTDPQPYQAVVDQLIELITRFARGEE